MMFGYRSEHAKPDASVGLNVVEVVVAVMTLQVGIIAVIVGIWRKRYRKKHNRRHVHELEAREPEVCQLRIAYEILSNAY
jgi:hypothetical protein